MSRMAPLPIRDLEHVLRHTTPHWEELRDGALFLTGGTGFFGTWLLESFAHATDALGLKARLMVLTRDTDAARVRLPHLAGRRDIAWLAGDVRTFAYPAGEFTHVIHAASPIARPYPPAEALDVLDTIIAGTRHVLEFARVCHARKLLFTSSGAVYGRQPPNLPHMPENFAGAPALDDPRAAYGEGKRVAEWLCRMHAARDGFEVKIARGFAFVGPRLPLDGPYAIGNFLRDALRGGPVVVSGDGTPYRSYLYGADLAIWLWTILLAGRPGVAYNVGSEQAVTIAETARRVCAVVGSGVVEIRETPVPGRPPERYVPSTALARSELRLAEHVSLDEALRRTTEALRA